MIKIRICRETEHMYKYEVTVSDDLREMGRFARPRKCYDAAIKYCTIHGLDPDHIEIPNDLKRMWGF